MGALRHRQLAEERRVLDKLRAGPMTFEEIAAPAALARLVQDGVVRVVGFRKPRRRGGEEPALFGIAEMGA